MTADPTIRVEDLSHGFRVMCSGEIDISNVQELRSAVDLCLGYRPLFLQIDFRDVTFGAWAAVEALVYARDRCRELGVRCLLPDSRHVQRLLHAVGCSSIDELQWDTRVGPMESQYRKVV